MIIFDNTTSPVNEKLAAKEMVLGLRFAEESKAYPFGKMPATAAINDRIGDRDLLVIFDRKSATAIPYSRTVGDQVLTFLAHDREDGLPLALIDTETGSEWNMLGQAISGPFKGARLTQLTAYNSMWFGWSAYWPETKTWQGEGILPSP